MIHDVTVPIRHGMPVYPDNPRVSVRRVRSIADGHSCNLTRLDLGVHSGTHVDAPAHFLDGGDSADATPLDLLIGEAHVLEVAGPGDVDADAVGLIPRGARRVLFKTRNSELWHHDGFAVDFARVTPAAAERLVELAVGLVGIDYLSVGGAETHEILLSAGVVVVEGLDLRGVAAGTYELVCLPLKLVDSDGAPARALLLEHTRL